MCETCQTMRMELEAMNKDAKATLSLCCGIVRKGWHEPSVMHDGLCREKHGGDLGKTYWLMDSGLQIDHEARMAYMERADMVARQLADLRIENDHMRAALANGPGPCVYCDLPRGEWNKCTSGFPGCARGDDAALCPHIGAGMDEARLRAALDGLVSAVEGISGNLSEKALQALEDARLALGPNVEPKGRAPG